MKTWRNSNRRANLLKTLQAASQKYAWPGGYPIAVIMSDGDVMCCNCATKERRRIIESTRSNSRDGWKVEGADILWEGPPETCCNCNSEIETAYGDPETDNL